jgi:hypothetical protein
LEGVVTFTAHRQRTRAEYDREIAWEMSDARRAALRNLRDGKDVFVHGHWADGMTYAEAMAVLDRLRGKDIAG